MAEYVNNDIYSIQKIFVKLHRCLFKFLNYIYIYMLYLCIYGYVHMSAGVDMGFWSSERALF